MSFQSWSAELFRQLALIPNDPGSVAADTWIVVGLFAVLLLRKVLSRGRSGVSLARGVRSALAVGVPGASQRSIKLTTKDLSGLSEAFGVQGTFGTAVSSSNIVLKPEQTEEIRNLLRAGRKIEAIKQIRAATGLGLAEAKQLSEVLEHTLGIS